MKIKITTKKDSTLKDDEIHISIETNKVTQINKLIEYINLYSKKIKAYKNNEIIELNLNDVITFYSDKKNNYCRTREETYRVKYKLYEIENITNDFIRISKSTIVNINYIKCFDIGTTGSVIVKLDDGTNEFVSRRKIKDVMRYLDERSI